MKIKRFFLIPTWIQWNKWSIPSKITLLGFYFTILVFIISSIWKMCDKPTPHEKIAAYHKTAMNFYKDKNYDKAINELLKVIEIDPNNVPSVELLAEIYTRQKNKPKDAKNALIGIKDVLSDKGKTMLMVLYYNDKEIDKAYKLSLNINPNRVEIYWAQFYYSIKCGLLVEKKYFSKLKEFIANSVSELNQRILSLHPKEIHDNPYVQSQDSGPLIPIDYLCASSARFDLAGFSAIYFEKDDLSKMKNIRAAYAEYGIGISNTGKFVVTTQKAILFIRTILTNFNSSRKLNWSDIKITFNWLNQIYAGIEGKIRFNLPGTQGDGIFISHYSGATKNEMDFVKSTIDDFKYQYNLDNNGDRIIMESYQLSK
jgi:tetratricopeptide (TPR) repeat protein